MPEVKKWDEGQFCWTELVSDDVAVSKEFYSKLFNWDIEDLPLPDGGVYTMFKIRGANVAAATPKMAEDPSPTHWNSYIKVEDVDLTAKKAEQAGGTVLMPPFDVMDQGRMTFIADPTGGVVGLWQPMSNIGGGLIQEPGTLSWTELLTPEVDKAIEFYTEVFGYTSEEMPNPDQRYIVLNRDGKAQAGLMAPPMEGIPTHWAVYFEVEDCDAAAAKVKELGGSVFVEPRFVEQAGTFATCGDPGGATFSVIQPDPSTR